MKQNLLKMMSMCVMLLMALFAKAENVERIIYATDFTDWAAASAPTSVNVSTNFEHQTVTMSTTGGAQVAPTTQKGCISIAKGASGTFETTAIKSVTTISYTVATGAKGTKNTMKLEVKGDGDADWVLIAGTDAISAVTQPYEVAVNRTNVQLRWSNINTLNPAYLQNIVLNGNVESTKVPALASFQINGETLSAADIFAQQTDGTWTGATDISKTKPMVGDANPLTNLVASTGSVKSVAYDGDATQCKATIVVTTGVAVDDVTYILNMTQKVDYTITYRNACASDGVTINGLVVGSQTVEKDAIIGSFQFDPSVLGEGKFRGFYAQEIYRTSEAQPFDSYRKLADDYAATTVMTGDLTVYVRSTPVESSADARHEYHFSDYINGHLNPYFYAEEHEDIVMPADAQYSDATHGWLFKAGSTVTVKHTDNSLVALRLCTSNPAEATITVGSETISAKALTDARATAVKVSGTSTDITFNADTKVHAIMVTNDIATRAPEADGYIQVAAGDAAGFLAALEMANNEGNAKIFLPDGTYDLGERVLNMVYADNISIIGESMDGTVIVNAPNSAKEGIGLTGTIKNLSNGLYIQDVTLKDAMKYYESTSGAGRGVVLEDRGNQTICKNVNADSYQDTYYSYNSAAQYYWDGCKISGTVDFICGGGDVMFKDCVIGVRKRQKNGTGECTITAPTTSTQWGYVFKGCTIENEAASYNFGRSWRNTPKCVWIDTKMNQEPVATRWTLGGMNQTDMAVAAEYNSQDMSGNDVTPPAGTTVTFTNKKTTLCIVLTAEEAAQYTAENMYPTWRPDQIAAQVTEIPTSGVFLVNGEITTELPASGMVRVANERGGFGPEVEVTAIQNAPAVVGAKKAGQKVNALGQAVGTNYRGIVIAEGNKVMQ